MSGDQLRCVTEVAVSLGEMCEPEIEGAQVRGMAAETVTRICKQHKRNSHPKFLGSGDYGSEEIILH
jgi:hypothetical protein